MHEKEIFAVGQLLLKYASLWSFSHLERDADWNYLIGCANEVIKNFYNSNQKLILKDAGNNRPILELIDISIKENQKTEEVKNG